MAITYVVKVTRQALEQMQEITHYIAHELYAPDADFILWNGSRPQIKRKVFEQFVDEKLSAI